MSNHRQVTAPLSSAARILAGTLASLAVLGLSIWIISGPGTRTGRELVGAGLGLILGSLLSGHTLGRALEHETKRMAAQRAAERARAGGRAPRRYSLPDPELPDVATYWPEPIAQTNPAPEAPPRAGFLEVAYAPHVPATDMPRTLEEEPPQDIIEREYTHPAPCGYPDLLPCICPVEESLEHTASDAEWWRDLKEEWADLEKQPVRIEDDRPALRSIGVPMFRDEAERQAWLDKQDTEIFSSPPDWQS